MKLLSFIILFVLTYSQAPTGLYGNVQCSLIPYFQDATTLNFETFPEQTGYFYDAITQECVLIIKPLGSKVTQNFFLSKRICMNACPKS